jgi:hypothetical protein
MSSVHDAWIAPAPGIEIRGMSNRGLSRAGLFLCTDPDQSLTEDEYLRTMPVQGWSCSQPSDAIGFRIGLNLTPEVQPGLYTLFVNGQPVPFVIERERRARPMQLEVKACDVLEELGGPTPGLIFRRATPVS